MRQLRFVTLTEDSTGEGQSLLLETPDGSEQFALAVDPALHVALGNELPRLHVSEEPEPPSAAQPAGPAAPGAAARPDRPAPAPAAPAPAPISPREIQVRVRAGESPEDLAAAYGMPLERVMRFATAVVEERLRIAGEARRARARRSSTDGGEGKAVVFGEAVDDRFRAHGIDPDSVTWDARRCDDGDWLIAARWLGGEATHAAEWLFHRTTRSVTPVDDTAADLLSDRPIRPIAPPEPRPSLAAAPPLVPGVVAFPPMPDARTGPLPVVEDVFDQEAPPEGPRAVPPLVPAAAATQLYYEEPPLPLGLSDAAGRHSVGTLRNLGVTRREETDDEKAARARVPSWDDILLGIRRKED